MCPDSYPDVRKLTPTDAMAGDSAKDTRLLKESLGEATAFLQRFKWCRQIKASYFGLGIGGIVSVFLFEIEPAKAEVDRWLWVVVGDLPPAYLTTDCAPNPACALDDYIGAMREWAQAAAGGKSVNGLIPVSAPATPQNGRELLERLDFLEKHVLSNFADDLKAGGV